MQLRRRPQPALQSILFTQTAQAKHAVHALAVLASLAVSACPGDDNTSPASNTDVGGASGAPAATNTGQAQMPSAGEVAKGASTPAREALPGAVFYHSDWDWEPDTDPITGDTSLELKSVYRLRRFFDAGLVYIGKATEVAALSCPQAKADECAMYSVSADAKTVSIGDVDYAATTDALDAKDEHWSRVRPNATVDGEYNLAGYFGIVKGAMPSTKGVSLSLSSGKLHAARDKGGYAILGSELWGSCSDGCTLDGTYSIKEYTLELTTAAGKTKSLFLRRDGAELQIGRQWYKPK